jgi:hypothetical protein
LNRAIDVAKLHAAHHANVKLDINVYPYATWKKRLSKLNDEVPGARKHRTSPLIYEGCGETKAFIGGSDTFVELVQEGHEDDPEQEL